MNKDYLDSIVDHIKNNDTPSSLTPRDLFGAFGFYRRTKNNCRIIDTYLNQNNLIVDPHYNSVWVDTPVRLIPKEKAKRKNTEDPVKRLQLLPAANNVPCFIDNSETLDKAITLLMLHHYSHLPVTNKGRRGIVGYVSWKTIGEARAKGVYSEHVKDYVDKNVMVMTPDAPLLEAIKVVYKYGFVLVRNNTGELTGIVTTKDVSTQFLMWTQPFLMLETIENQIRTILDGKFLLDEIKGFCTEEKRDVNAIDDLTFGEYLYILQNPENWSRLKIKTIDHKTLVAELDKIREIRNDVMHFDPDGLENEQVQQLNNMCHFLSCIVSKEN